MYPSLGGSVAEVCVYEQTNSTFCLQLTQPSEKNDSRSCLEKKNLLLSKVCRAARACEAQSMIDTVAAVKGIFQPDSLAGVAKERNLISALSI